MNVTIGQNIVIAFKFDFHEIMKSYAPPMHHKAIQVTIWKTAKIEGTQPYTFIQCAAKISTCS